MRYTAVTTTRSAIFEEAAGHSVNMKEMEQICKNQAFQETALAVLPKLTKGEWPLLFPSKEHPGCYESALHFPPPELPLTALQMSYWQL